MTGAVDLRECPNYGKTRTCLCNRCAICGFGEHTAVHGPYFGYLPGSKPFGHQFISKAEAQP